MIKNKTLSNILDYFIKGTYAGILIGIGGTVYLSVQNNVAGSFLFSIGLLTICMYQMNLYTGKVGYVLVNKISYLIVRSLENSFCWSGKKSLNPKLDD